MTAVKALAASFLAVALAGCGPQGAVFSCNNAGRKAVVFDDGNLVMLSLQKSTLLSLNPYVEGYEEIWQEISSRKDAEYQTSVASTYCRTGNLPASPAP
ncbi:MAG: hypothetical protein JWO78_1701 [Micavibrio sp.]|nr:hypothetical protein [Micavibrio sp.]